MVEIQHGQFQVWDDFIGNIDFVAGAFTIIQFLWYVRVLHKHIDFISCITDAVIYVFLLSHHTSHLFTAQVLSNISN
jgi:hypothetical protein